MSLKEKLLYCYNCKKNFTFTVEDQELRSSQGYPNDPVNCPTCRRARKSNISKHVMVFSGNPWGYYFFHKKIHWVSLFRTPASIKANDPPQTEAMELEPFDSVISETILIVYANSSSGGLTCSNARSARAPCPISLRLVPRIGRTSPTENGGKL